MTSPDALATRVKQAFETINEDSMKGLPIVNPVLEVETVGFMEHGGRTVGVIVTPWLMTLALFPGEDDDWSAVEVGAKAAFEFPARKYDFLANEIEGVGPYYGFALHSPMHEFQHQPHAVSSAEAFLEMLMVENENPEDELDEERLARFLNGEDMEEIKLKECRAAKTEVDGETTLGGVSPRDMGRREFMSGGIRSRPRSAV